MEFEGKLDPNMWVAHYGYTGMGSYRRVDASQIRVLQLKDIDFRTSDTISNIVLPGKSGGYGGTTIVYEEGAYYIKGQNPSALAKEAEKKAKELAKQAKGADKLPALIEFAKSKGYEPSDLTDSLKPEFMRDYGKYQVKIRVFCPGSGSSGAKTVLFYNNAAQAWDENNFRNPQDAFLHAIYDARELIMINRRKAGI